MSGGGVVFPARFVAGAVLAGVRLSSSVPASSPVVAAVRLALARSLRLAALAPHTLRDFNAERSHAGPITPVLQKGKLPAWADAIG